jgi:hypothetical protein
MSRDFLTLGSTPWNEDCAGVGQPDYEARSIAECKRYKTLLEELFPVPDGVYGCFGIKSFQHDFGTYREVVAYFDADVMSNRRHGLSMSRIVCRILGSLAPCQKER